MFCLLHTLIKILSFTEKIYKQQKRMTEMDKTTIDIVQDRKIDINEPLPLKSLKIMR